MSSEDLDEILLKLVDKYIEKTKKSREMFERALRVLPGGTTYHIRYLEPYPVYVSRAKGSRVWDIDGNEYDDYWMGHGAHILGHAPDFVVETVSRISRDGTHFGFENVYAIEYAELLVKVVPNIEMVRFCNSGTEANMYAVRLARAYTRKRYVVKIEGGWHGSLDQLHVAVTPPFTGPESLGIPQDFVKYTIAVPFNDVESLEKVVRGLDVAAIFVEPVPGAGGCIEPEEGYLKEVRRIADSYGTLLVFDEVITGFRLALGGAQEFFNVRADLVVFGKIIGGGYPGSGAFAGRREFMELLDQIKYPSPRQRVFHGGTFVGNPITMAAGYTLIEYLARSSSLYTELNDRWRSAARKMDRICEEYDRVCWITSTGSMMGIHFTSKKPRSIAEVYMNRWDEKVYKALHIFMIINGIIYLSERVPHIMPSMVHSEKQVLKFIDKFAEFLSILPKISKQVKQMKYG